MELLKPTRRSFLSGLASLFAAPAIIKFDSLMPVKVMPTSEVLDAIATEGYNGVLTIEMITKEAVRLFEANCRALGVITRKPRTSPEDVADNKIFASIDRQSFIDIEASSIDRTLPLDKFSERFLAPAMHNLAEHHRGEGPISLEPLPVPRGVHEATSQQRGNVNLRGVNAYNIDSDSFIFRFDAGSKKRL